jgi:hypothetical protein
MSVAATTPQPHRHRLQKENCPPPCELFVASSSHGLSPNAPPTETPSKAPEQSAWPAQTPTKIAQGIESGARASRTAVDTLGQKWGFEVKNTFIHYGSPLKTVSVVTPPKTVPSNFAPEVLLFEQPSARLRTPAAVIHAAATPSTAGGALAGGRDFCSGAAATMGAPTSVYFAAPAPPAAAQPAISGAATNSTLLRLSDFLPSPAASTCVAASGAMAAGAAQTSTQTLLPGVSCAWQQQACCYVDSGMPPVPPLPGPSCQAPTSASVVTPTAISTMPPPPPPPHFSAFDVSGMQVATASYVDPLQFITGEAPMAASTSMTMLPPQVAQQQPPTLPLDQTFQLSSQCGVSPMNSMGGPSQTSNMFCMGQTMSVLSPMNMGGSTPMGGMTGSGPACGSMQAESSLGAFCMGTAIAGSAGTGPAQSLSCSSASGPGGMTVSISAGHFPEPGSQQACLSDTSPRLTGAPETISLEMAWM